MPGWALVTGSRDDGSDSDGGRPASDGFDMIASICGLSGLRLFAGPMAIGWRVQACLGEKKIG